MIFPIFSGVLDYLPPLTDEEVLDDLNLELNLFANEDRVFDISNLDYLKPRDLQEINELFDKASFEKLY